MPLTQAQQDYVKQGGVIQSSDPSVMADYSAFVRGGSSGTSPITPASVESTKAITLPTLKVSDTNYNSALASGNTQIDLFKKYLDTQIAPPDKEKSLTDLYGKTSAEIAQEQQTAGQEAIKARSVSRQATAEVAGVQAEIQAIIDRRDASLLTLENDAVGRGITKAGLEPDKQAINRRAAIEALPLQSKALIAQAKAQSLQGLTEEAQATYAMANDKLNKVFQYKTEDAQNYYDFRKEQQKAIYDFLSDAEKTRWATLQKSEDRNRQLFTDAKNNAQKLAEIAIANGQGDIAGEITQAFSGIDINSKDLQGEIKRAEEKVANLQAKIKPKVDLTASAGSLEEFKIIYGRIPKNLEELNTFTKSRDMASKVSPKEDDIGLVNSMRMSGYRPSLQAKIDMGASPEQSVQLILNELGADASNFSEDDIRGLNYLAKQLIPSAIVPEILGEEEVGGLFGAIKELFKKKDTTDKREEKKKEASLNPILEGYQSPISLDFFNNLYH